MEFIRLDARSEWAARLTVHNQLRQGKLAEARQNVQQMGTMGLMDRDLLEACLNPQRASTLSAVAKQTEAATLGVFDSEPRYLVGTLMAFCGQKNAALHLLRSAIKQSYCAYTALQTDPLLSKLRGTAEYSDLLSAGKECQNRFLAQRYQSPN